MVESRFGMVLRGVKSNERRMLALGFPTFRYKLVGYVVSAQVCVVAGFLLANLTKFASPSYMVWQVSGDLIVMAVLGGMSTLFGPVAGAVIFLVVEEVLSSVKPGWFPQIEEVLNKHWLALMGIFVIAIVLGFRKGIYGYVVEKSSKEAKA
jgi:branched-chain amino acid transport system permease protein